VGTIAFYGPTDRIASKVSVGIVKYEGGQADILERWYAEEDVRNDPEIGRQIQGFLAEHNILTVVMADRIIGCPHEEGKDYPNGEACPQCPFWRNRDRFTGELIN
jgi:hypothetical protein